MIEGIDMELRIFSFFSGAGFLDLGFEKEKYEVVFVNEYSNEFLKAYKFAREKMGMKSPRLGYYCGDINDLLRGEQRKELEKKIQDMKKEGFIWLLINLKNLWVVILEKIQKMMNIMV